MIAYGRAGDALLALSTSGSSANVIAALAEARRRGLRDDRAASATTAGAIAAEGLADHVVVTRSEHIPRIQEAQASAYHVLRELVEMRVRRRRRAAARSAACARGSRATVQGVGFRPFVYRLAPRARARRLRAATTSAACCSRSRATRARSSGFLARLPREAPPLARVERGARASRRAPTGERGFAIVASARGGRAGARSVTPDTRDLRRLPAPSCSTRATAATATRSSTARTAGRASRSCAASRTTGRCTTMAGFAMCAALPGRVRRPARPALPRPAERVPGVRAAARCSTATAPRGRGDDPVRGAAARAARRARSSRSRASAATTSPAAPTTSAAVAALRARKHREDRPFALMARRRRGGAGARRRSAPEDEALLRRPRAADRARAAPAGRRGRGGGRAALAPSSA